MDFWDWVLLIGVLGIGWLGLYASTRKLPAVDDGEGE